MRNTLFTRLVAAASVALGCAWATAGEAAAETRTLSLYQVHTKESITVTYKKNGRYIPEAMRQINWLLRDWRRNQPTTMAPETIDLMWELHADLGSRKPIHIISGYRSADTNAMLKRIGRKVAKQSMHIQGRAIDLYFPDVPIATLRGSAFVRQVGGVGYYPSSGAMGFVHIDNGNVRHWPRMNPTQIAGVWSKYRKTVAARNGRSGWTQYAAVETKPAKAAKPVAAGPTSILPDGLDEDDSASVVAAAVQKSFAPKPRPKPIEVLMLAAAAMKVEPAAAPVPKHNFSADAQSPLGKSGPLTIAALAAEAGEVAINSGAKGSFATAVLRGEAPDTPLVRPLDVSYANSSALADLFAGTERTLRHDGAPQPFETGEPASLSAHEKSTLERMIAALMPGSDAPETVEVIEPAGINVDSKADMLVVNRAGKSNMLGAGPATVIQRNSDALLDQARLARLALDEDGILATGDKPLGF